MAEPGLLDLFTVNVSKNSDSTGSINNWQSVLSPVGAVGICWCIFQIAIVFWPYVDELIKRSAHVSFALSMALLLTSAGFNRPARLLNLALALVALVPPVLIWLDLVRITDRISGLDPVLSQDYVGTFILLGLLFEVSRRTLGIGMTCLGLAFLAYQFFGGGLPGLLAHSAGDFSEFVDTQFLTIEGVFGVPTAVSVGLVFYFILFAAVFETFGGGKMIIDLSLALTGARTGGPAKAAVLSSGLMGSVSGSAVANVMSSGIFTIPLMKRIKYNPIFAAGVEAVASTGGQIMPPVMGAAAFIMADYLQIPYKDIVLAAILPALLYFSSIMICVDLEARRKNLPLIPASQVPAVRETFRTSGHMLLPLAWLVYRIIEGDDITSLIMEVILITIVVGLLRATTRVGLKDIINSFITAAKRCVSVAVPCALASLIVSVITFTGLGTKFTSIILSVAGNELALMLVMAMIATLILGAGMPTTSAYIMGAVLIAPALIQFDLDPLVSHFFVFYFAILSMLTPPVALSAYAAASIAETSPSKTGWQAMFLALPGFVIPYCIVMHPGLLLIGPVQDTLLGLISVLFGLGSISVAIIGWFLKPLSLPIRFVLLLAALGALWPDPVISLGVCGLLVIATLWTCIAAKTAKNGPKHVDTPPRAS